MTLFNLVKGWFVRRVVPTASQPQTIELAHAVLDRRRACKDHADLVASIVSSPINPDAFGAMVQDMRGRKRPRNKRVAPA